MICTQAHFNILQLKYFGFQNILSFCLLTISCNTHTAYICLLFSVILLGLIDTISCHLICVKHGDTDLFVCQREKWSLVSLLLEATDLTFPGGISDVSWIKMWKHFYGCCECKAKSRFHIYENHFFYYLLKNIWRISTFSHCGPRFFLKMK